MGRATSIHLRGPFSPTFSLLSTLFLICFFHAAFLAGSQTTWTGSTSTDWNVAGNWTAGVPNGATDVDIPNVANDPTISAAGAVAKSITVQSGAVLTINAAASLTINGSSAQGILNYGTVRNLGTISIGAISSVELYGIYNRGTFTNHEGATITIDRSSSYGLFNHSGTFNNYANLRIGGGETIGVYGIANAATFNNGTGGNIQIDRSTSTGLYNLTGTVTNLATISIGSIASVGTYGIYNEATFNNSGGTINIDRSTVSGLYNFSSGSFTNAATIRIGNSASVGNYGLRNEATFSNNSGGAIHIDRSSDTGLRNNSGTFTNAATITLGANQSLGSYGLYNTATFNNNTGGTINIDRSGYIGLYNYTNGTFNNQATLTIGGSNWAGSFGLWNRATFNNNAGGTINIDRVGDYGIRNEGGTFTNQASIVIGANAGWGSFYMGLYNSSTFNNNTGGTIQIDRTYPFGLYTSGTFTNQASIVIGANASVGSYGLYNNSTFNNNTGGVIQINNSTISGIYNYISSSYSFNNQGSIIIGASSSVGTYGIRNDYGSFNNNTGGSIQVNNATNSGIYNYNNGTITNQAGLTIGASNSIGSYGINNNATFNNNTGGSISIDNSAEIGLFNAAGTFTNAATISVGSVASVGLYGMRNDATFNNNTGGTINLGRSGNTGLYNLSGTFTNVATINVGASAVVGFYGILNHALFNNNTNGIVTINKATIAGLHAGSSTFTNKGTVTIGPLPETSNLITANTGTFSNSSGGLLKGTGNIPANNFTNSGGTLSPGYSPGKMTFTGGGEEFSSSTMSIEVNGTGVAGANYDQIVVQGTATLGGTLALSINYTGGSGDEVTILSATAISGTFSNVTGRPVEWGVTYTATEVKLVWLEVGERLPVELTDFKARWQDSKVFLNWRTASELNNLGFDIERSTNGRDWEAIGFVSGKGTTAMAQAYDFTDEKPFAAHLTDCTSGCTNYYRLRQVDFDGKFEYSKVRSVVLPTAVSLLKAFPNPANGFVNIQVGTTYSGDAVVNLYNQVGFLLKQNAVTLDGKPLQFALDLSGIPAGVYYITLLAGHERLQQRLIVR